LETPLHTDGECDARFASVRDAFRENFAALDEIGAAVCIRVGGRVVVDLWGGVTDPDTRTPWQRDTLVNAYSVGKGVLAILTLAVLEDGRVDLEAPVSASWPEFAAAGKGDATLATLLAHRVGCPAVRELLPAGAMYDWDRMCAALARQQPFWEPDRDHGYHTNTFGFLVGEVLRRATDKPVGALLRERLAGPRGADFFYGLPRSEHHRVARLCAPDMVLTTREQWAMAFPPTGDDEHDTMIWHCYFNPTGVSGNGEVNTAAWRASVIPSTSGHATARAVANLYGGVLAGEVAGPALLAEATRIHSDGDDRVLGRPSRFGLGFQLSQESRPLGAGGSGFGHYGYGGSLGYADPESGVAFAYLTNRPGARWQTPRTQRLIEALHGCL